MKKRPLCAICIFFLVIQSVRVFFFGVEETESSALERIASENACVRLTGTVYRIEEKKKVTAFYLRENTVTAAGQNIREAKILVYYSKEQKNIRIKHGNILEVSGEAQLFDKARNPGNFDQRTYYRRQGIHVLIWADDIEVRSDATDHLRQCLYEIRQKWDRLLIRHLGEYYGGTMSAVLLGEKGGLDEELKSIYQKSGISHLLAISGLHMTFLGMGLYRMLRRIGLGFVPAGIAGSVLLVLYCLMTGAGVSSLRALIMFLVRIGAEITGRDYDLPTSLALSAALLCGRQPLYLADAGFLLSYGAMAGIVMYEPVMSSLFGCDATSGDKRRAAGRRKRFRRLRKVVGKAWKWTARGLGTSIAVNLLLLGPLLYFYYEIPPYSVFLNLIVIPVMPAAMGAGVIGSVLAPVSDTAGGIVLQICKAVLAGYDLVCEIAVRLPGSRFVTGKPELWQAGLYYFILLLLYLLFRHFRKKKERAVQACVLSGSVSSTASKWQIICKIPGCLSVVAAVCMAVLCRQGYQTGEGIEAAALDVGQGDCLFVRGPSARFLIDGGSSDVSEAGKYRIEPYLLGRAVDELDYVFVTHGDTDHTSGIQEMLENQALGVRIRTLVLPPRKYHEESILELAETAQENDTRIVLMKTGDRITDRKEKSGRPNDELVFTCLGPDESKEMEAGNGASLVLEASYGRFRMLFTGDLEGRGEELLVQSGRLGSCAVLKAAHHGSGDSGTEAFLEAVQPRITLISAGRDNRYGHPHEETVERLRQCGSSVYSTQEYGALTVCTDGRRISIRGTMKEAPCETGDETLSAALVKTGGFPV